MKDQNVALCFNFNVKERKELNETDESVKEEEISSYFQNFMPFGK